MPRARDDIHMAVAQALGGVADAPDQHRIKRRRVEKAHHFGGEFHPDIGADARRGRVQLVHHRLKRLKDMAAEIYGEHHLFGDDVAAVGIDVDLPDRADGIGLILQGYFMHQLGHAGEGAARVAAHVHGR